MHKFNWFNTAVLIYYVCIYYAIITITPYLKHDPQKLTEVG